MAVGKNTIVKEIAVNQVFDDITGMIASTASFNQGDLLMYSPTTYQVTTMVAEADAQYFIGVATEDIVTGKPRVPYSTDVDSSIAAGAVNGPIYGVVASCILQTGQTINPGQAMYAAPSAGGRYVAGAGTKIIGVYEGSAIASSVAGQVVNVRIGARYPGDTLKF